MIRDTYIGNACSVDSSSYSSFVLYQRQGILLDECIGGDTMRRTNYSATEDTFYQIEYQSGCNTNIGRVLEYTGCVYTTHENISNVYYYSSPSPFINTPPAGYMNYAVRNNSQCDGIIIETGLNILGYCTGVSLHISFPFLFFLSVSIFIFIVEYIF